MSLSNWALGLDRFKLREPIAVYQVSLFLVDGEIVSFYSTDMQLNTDLILIGSNRIISAETYHGYVIFSLYEFTYYQFVLALEKSALT